MHFVRSAEDLTQGLNACPPNQELAPLTKELVSRLPHRAPSCTQWRVHMRVFTGGVCRLQRPSAAVGG
jgi:hypothetical protein